MIHLTVGREEKRWDEDEKKEFISFDKPILNQDSYSSCSKREEIRKQWRVRNDKYRSFLFSHHVDIFLNNKLLQWRRHLTLCLTKKDKLLRSSQPRAKSMIQFLLQSKTETKQIQNWKCLLKLHTFFSPFLFQQKKREKKKKKKKKEDRNVFLRDDVWLWSPASLALVLVT